MPTPINGADTLQNAAPPGRGGDAAPSLMVPFVRASRRQRIPTELDRSVLLGAASVQVESFEIPAQGWLRGIWLLVTASGGLGGSAVAAADAPWSLINSIQLTDPAGNPIFGPLSGYSMYLANRFGGYSYFDNPDTPLDSGADDVINPIIDANGNFSFILWLPIEASQRDAYGALPNQDSSASYRVNLTQAPSTAVYDTPPAGTLPTVRYQAWADVWTQPTPVDLAGTPQAQQPPGAGTTQFWTQEIQSAVGGDNTFRVRRVGNLFRTLVVVSRNAAGARVTLAQMPPSVRWFWDSLVLTDQPQRLVQLDMVRKYGGNSGVNAANVNVLPTGVMVFTYADDLDGHPGFELRNALLPTTKATRLELQGSWGVAGSVQFLINDIQPVNLP